MTELTNSERTLLHWLGQEDFSQFGECHGPALDGLVAKGLAQLHEGREQQSGFIAQGDGPMYRAVSVTDAGHAILTAQDRRVEQRIADRIDGYDRDDLGESPDF